MACKPERASEALPGGLGPIRALYEKLSQFPCVTYASVGVGHAGCGGAACLPLYTEWCQPDLGCFQQLQFSRQYILHLDGRAVVSVTPVGVPAEIRDQLLIRMSPTGRHKAVLTHRLEMGQKQEVLEVWSSSGRVRYVNLTALDKHGRVYTDGQFGCFAWSSSEKQILYVAERRRPKRQPLFPPDRSLKEGDKQSEARKEGQFVYNDNWGEALADKSVPVLCMLNTETCEVAVLEGIPGHISPGQALWSPDDMGIVFVGWWHEPFRLGLHACSNRRSALFLLDLSKGSCELLSSDNQAVSAPRLSPDRTRLVYLEGPVFGPHRQCLKLQMLNWQTKLTSTVVDTVRTATAGFFGIYQGSLPLLCWAKDSKRVLISTPQRSRKELLVVDTTLGCVKTITAVNYRGSLGFGQASIDSLISHVGVQDVEDTQRAVELALQMEPVDPNRIGLWGGSHGGFICCHLIGQYPERYKACAVRSPVINMATLLGTSDIPDWRYTALGLPYCFERIPTEEDLAAMLLSSPITHAAKVRAPLLLCVGARDRRVSPYQAVEYYRVLRARGIPVRLLSYPEEGHAISGVEAKADVFMNCAQWIMHYLSMEASAESQQPTKNADV
ncbi:acylamino-acid-releasing enzyme-like [Varanus komodoensis]|uniref:acylamino-acid-releasing enzyme-like n=1 Tax=Varanus komodoensis TaxID=61221 RepID=UPI001CF7C126|nr:acylamino-acid-releasing enzyme-like [Varanus komodoensis]